MTFLLRSLDLKRLFVIGKARVKLSTHQVLSYSFKHIHSAHAFSTELLLAIFTILKREICYFLSLIVMQYSALCYREISIFLCSSKATFKIQLVFSLIYHVATGKALGPIYFGLYFSHICKWIFRGKNAYVIWMTNLLEFESLSFFYPPRLSR